MFYPQSTETPEECKEKANAQPNGDAIPPVGEATGHGQHHGHHHGHGHSHGFHPRGAGHGHNYNHGHDGHGRGQGQQDVRQHRLDLGQMQQIASSHLLPQEADGAPVRP